MLRRLALVLVLLAALSAPAGSATTATAAAGAPSALRAFLLRADEPTSDLYPRTPSFAWAPYAGATSYDFELATSRSFDDSSVVWSTDSRSKPLTVPLTAIPVSLPWVAGSPYGLYAHVRAHTSRGVTPWSAPLGFNLRWRATPAQLAPDYPGLVRWSPVDGATSYQVWFVGPGKIISTTTNAADEREAYTFHHDAEWTKSVQWRVRAVRQAYGTPATGVPVVSTGPWSPVFTSTNPDFVTGGMALRAAVSETVSTPSTARAHRLTPGFAFEGDTSERGTTARLFRVYIATDRDCVDIVYRGPVVGSPAWAPRVTGPLALPTTDAAVTAAEAGYLEDGNESGTYGADLKAVTTDEQTAPATAATQTATAAAPSSTGSSSTGSIPAEFGATGSPVDLRDSGWPSGRYFWTVVPVKETATSSSWRYDDLELPQDACAAGRVAAFGKVSEPATTSGRKPFVSGVTPRGTLAAASSAAPTFSGAALVSWEPAPDATGYEVQWSRTKNPWIPVARTPLYTAGTSVLLDGLTSGHWFYRVRGIDPYLTGAVKQMPWSEPVEVVLIGPRYSVQTPAALSPGVKITPLG
jgi:hypothetical protein